MSAALLLDELYPGNNENMARLRVELEEISRTPGRVTVLIEGLPGTGKTTMARALAMSRMLSIVDSQYHRMSVERAANEVRAGAAWRWYRDISLAGLTATLADLQLFGVAKGAATDVVARVGIFEQAMTGCLNPRTNETHKKLISEAQRNDMIPLATGGVVLLDEIGDLTDELQGKLLRVLNGERQFRVGAEGHADFGFTFRGIAVLATWRNIDGPSGLREDLRQRILQHRIRVPGISEFPREVRLKIVRNTEETVKREIREDLALVEGLIPDAANDAPQVLAVEWLAYVNRGGDAKVPSAFVEKLADLDWSKYGEFRGLREALRKLLCGRDIDSVLAETKATFGAQQLKSSETNLDRLKRYLANKDGFSRGWMNDRRQWAIDILRELDNDGLIDDSLVSNSGRTIADIKKELRNLTRSGSGMSEA